MSKALDTVARLRKMEAEQAKRDLAAAVAAEMAAARALTQAQAVVAREARVVNPSAPGAFAAWLPEASATIKRCVTAKTQAGMARESARAALAGRRSALKAAETLVEERTQREKLVADRRATRVLDDMARRGREEEK